MNEILPPQDIDAEMAVLGAIILNPKCALEVREYFPMDASTYFYKRENAYIFKAMTDLMAENKGIDPITIRDALGEELEAAGGISYLAELTGLVPTSANVLHYAGIVRECASKRQAIAIAKFMQHNIQAGKSLDFVINVTRKSLNKCEQATPGGLDMMNTESISEELNELRSGDPEHAGVMTGVANIDDLTRGFRPGELVIMAARTGGGKTALAANMAVNAARTGRRVFMFTLEMQRNELARRIIGIDGRFNVWAYENGRGGSEMPQKFDTALAGASGLPIFIDDRADLTIEMIEAETLKATERHGKPDLIVIDYLQLITDTSSKDRNSRQESVAAMSRRSKILAGTAQCPVVAISQLSRAADQDEPRLSHLRESGAIEQDANKVILLGADGLTQQGNKIITVYIAKNRNGPTGKCKVMFNLGTQVFTPIDEKTEDRQGEIGNGPKSWQSYDDKGDNDDIY